MSDAEQEALGDYTVSSFYRINEGSRSGQMSADDAKAASILDSLATDS